MAVLSFVARPALRACDAAAIYAEAILAMRVLIADDSPIVHDAIADLLRAADLMTVIRAMDGPEALRLAAEGHPDVVILDYDMPGMNGIETGRAIRERSPAMPLILITATASEYLIASALTAGFAGFLLKRDVGDDLVRAIDAVRFGATFVSPGAARALYERYLPSARLA